MQNRPARDIHWQVTANAGPATTRLSGECEVDVAIIGAGLTGCRTALGLADAGRSVALLDAEAIGHGASGRSGGQCNPMWRQTPDELKQRFGPEQGQRLIDTTIGAADALFSDIRHFGIECDAVQNGWVQAAHTRSARQSLQRLMHGWSGAGARISELEGSCVNEVSGSPAYRYALFHEAGGHVHPLSLTRGYAAAAAQRGASLFCGDAVQSLTRTGDHWLLRTKGGTLRSAQVVLCTNAYTTDSPLAGLSRTFVPMVSIIMATEPLTEAQRASVLPGSVTLSDTRLAIYYCRLDREGRLLFGCIGSSENVSVAAEARLRQGLATVFPQLQGIGIERVWGGRIAMTAGMMPHIHEPAPGLTAALGFSGRGIAMTSVMGRALTQRLLGEPAESLPFPVSPMQAMPLQFPARTLVPLAAPLMSLKDRIDSRLDAI